MTNQEAIEAIKLARSQVEWDYPMDYAAAFDKAIEALEQEPVIRDNGVKDELNRVKDELGVASGLEKNSKELEKDFGELDCISREEVLKLMKDNWHTHNGDWAMQESMDDIRALPSVTPQEPKTGYWKDIPKYKDIAWLCSECKHFTTMKHNYCPNCGAKMVEPQESEDT